MLVNYVHNVSYLAERAFTLDGSDKFKAQTDGTFNLPICFLPAGAIVTQVYLQMNAAAAGVTANVGFNEEASLFINAANLGVTTPATSAIVAKVKKDGAVILNVSNATAAGADGIAYVEYYLPAQIKTEI